MAAISDLWSKRSKLFLIFKKKVREKSREWHNHTQSQAVALPRYQREEETDKTKQAQIEQTHEKHEDQLSLPQAR